MTKHDNIMKGLERIVEEVFNDPKVAAKAEEDQRRNTIITERDRGIVFTI